jgi:hypothetical protein
MPLLSFIYSIQLCREAYYDNARTARITGSGGTIACLPAAVSGALPAVFLRDMASAACRVDYRGSGDGTCNAEAAVRLLIINCSFSTNFLKVKLLM